MISCVTGALIGIALIFFMASIAWGYAFSLAVCLTIFGYAFAHHLFPTLSGGFSCGLLSGLNAGLNMFILSLFGPVGLVLAVFIGTTNFLVIFQPVSTNSRYQSLLGWSNWLMPMSWLVNSLGLLFLLLSVAGHILFGRKAFFRLQGFKLHLKTGMFAIRGGWIANLNTYHTAFNMGNFAFVDCQSCDRRTGQPIWHLDHEAGHTLNLGAYGFIFHFTGFIHEVAFGAGAHALAERFAESNVPGTLRPFLSIWQDSKEGH